MKNADRNFIRSTKLFPARMTWVLIVFLTLASCAFGTDFKPLYKFANPAGKGPVGGVTFDSAGNLYGATRDGGPNGYGTVFQLTPNPDGSWSETVLHGFNNVDGQGPSARPTLDLAGNLYVATAWGGGGAAGTICKLTRNKDGSWTTSTLYTFTGPDGANPLGELVLDATGNLYGTTANGGASGRGTVFKLTPNPDGSWTETVLCSFAATYGTMPSAGVVFDKAGNLYGTTSRGGAYGFGAIFELTPNPDGNWTEQVLHSFTGRKDGDDPVGRLILDAAGNLYGTTYAGGKHAYGTVFKLSRNPNGNWQLYSLRNFKGPDGGGPQCELALNAAGNLYGTTAGGGKYGYGTVYKLWPSPYGGSIEQLLHSFRGKDGRYPMAGVVLDSSGNLFGTTFDGGKRHGVVFEVTP